MRHAPTSSAFLWTIAAILGASLMACAAQGEDPSDPSAADPTADKEQTAPDTTTGGDDADKKPAFQASFQAGADGGAPATDDATKDPTPPGGGSQCLDASDPGGSETTASKLPDTDDCDTNYKDVSGVANGGVDVDYYSLAATDKGISFEHPLGCEISADFQDETAGTELCVYARCQNSTADAVTGCDQGTPSTSDIGMQGCCAAAPGRAVPQWNCDGLDDSVSFFVRVREIDNTNQCLPYKLTYKF